MNNFFRGCNLLFQHGLFAGYMDWFHAFSCSLLLGVLVFVTLLFGYLIFGTFYFKGGKVEYQFGELLCSVFPTIILLVRMVPSLGLLYYCGLMNLDGNLTVGVAGHRWCWGYEYGDIPGLEFDSCMESLDRLGLGEPRLLEVDNRCVIPCDTSIRFCITSAGVIHAWALSSLSVKLDAMGGILSTFGYGFPVVGVFCGQCSGICGASRSFVPVALEVTLLDSFESWCFGTME